MHAHARPRIVARRLGLCSALALAGLVPSVSFAFVAPNPITGSTYSALRTTVPAQLANAHWTLSAPGADFKFAAAGKIAGPNGYLANASVSASVGRSTALQHMLKVGKVAAAVGSPIGLALAALGLFYEGGQLMGFGVEPEYPATLWCTLGSGPKTCASTPEAVHAIVAPTMIATWFVGPYPSGWTRVEGGTPYCVVYNGSQRQCNGMYATVRYPSGAAASSYNPGVNYGQVSSTACRHGSNMPSGACLDSGSPATPMSEADAIARMDNMPYADPGKTMTPNSALVPAVQQAIETEPLPVGVPAVTPDPATVIPGESVTLTGPEGTTTEQTEYVPFQGGATIPGMSLWERRKTTVRTANDPLTPPQTTVETVNPGAAGGPVTEGGGTPQEDKDHCDDHPERVGCQQLGETPPGEVPKESRIAPILQPVSLGLPVGCPSAIETPAGTISIQPWCDAADYVAPIVVALGALAAALTMAAFLRH